MVIMAEYTFYIPKEFLTGEVATIQIFILFIIVIAIILFFGYKIFIADKKRRRPESF